MYFVIQSLALAEGRVNGAHYATVASVSSAVSPREIPRKKTGHLSLVLNVGFSEAVREFSLFKGDYYGIDKREVQQGHSAYGRYPRGKEYAREQ